MSDTATTSAATPEDNKWSTAEIVSTILGSLLGVVALLAFYFYFVKDHSSSPSSYSSSNPTYVQSEEKHEIIQGKEYDVSNLRIDEFRTIPIPSYTVITIKKNADHNTTVGTDILLDGFATCAPSNTAKFQISSQFQPESVPNCEKYTFTNNTGASGNLKITRLKNNPLNP